MCLKSVGSKKCPVLFTCLKSVPLITLSKICPSKKWPSKKCPSKKCHGTVHVPILFLVCIIVIAIVAACLIGKLFWSFNFKNKGLEPIFKKKTFYDRETAKGFHFWFNFSDLVTKKKLIGDSTTVDKFVERFKKWANWWFFCSFFGKNKTVSTSYRWTYSKMAVSVWNEVDSLRWPVS